MNLTDKEILELNELCSAVVDGTLTDVQKARLSQWLSESTDVRQYYVRALGQSASLHYYASEMQTGAPDQHRMRRKILQMTKWMFTTLAIAASFVVMVWIARPKREAPAALPTPAADVEFVAQLTGTKDAQWASSASAVPPGGQLRKGQHLDLAKGLAEITFDSGATIVLQGPASLDVNSAWNATLNRGTLKASFLPEAMGFSVSNPRVEVVDMGTEFIMSADPSGVSTDVVVLKGEVEAGPSTPSDQTQIKMKERESRTFTASGVSAPRDGSAIASALAQPLAIDHFVPPAGFAHWSFDEAMGDTFKVENSGLSFNPSDVRVLDATPEEISDAHAPGRTRGGLQFDGHLYGMAAFPGISDYTAHTVLFWVCVPKDANLSYSYSMLAWGVNNPQLGSHPIHIGWNNRPNEAAVGVLRTDYGGGFAVGSTPLRDGRWHHIAVVFIPRDDPKRPMEVKQYVDGRLEGEGEPSPPGSDIFAYSASNTLATSGAVYLGCRLGQDTVRLDRFKGTLDELYIADRALEPQEIWSLMNNN